MMGRDDERDRRDVSVEDEEVVVVAREGDAPADRRDVLEGVVPEDTGEPRSTARPDFARGQAEHEVRLEGMVTDRFSRGQEDDPTLHEQVHEGDFARGQAEEPRHPETTLEGRFARGQQATDPGASDEDDDVPSRPDR
jgi:hypothetical protein